MLLHHSFIYNAKKNPKKIAVIEQFTEKMVSLVKVEDEINKLLPEETICCVVDIPDQIKGAEIVAVVTTKQIDHKDIRKKLNKVLPKIAIPKKFAIMNEMPMTSSGKVNFRAVEAKCRNEEMETF